MGYIKAKPWSGKALSGHWHLTLKIDGVRALWDGKRWLSRADKPLYNIPAWNQGLPTDCEVYLGSFRDTIRAVRTQKLKDDTPRIGYEHLYGLDPLDPRLARGVVFNPTQGMIEEMLGVALDQGYEGLVLRQGTTWLKVKPEETYDVAVTGAIEGTGKHAGRLGALETDLGEVGTGFSDEERQNLWLWHTTGHNGIADCPLAGQVIEVSCLQLTPDGKFRHPRFVRLRPDKST
jgi:hypothetical protein